MTTHKTSTTEKESTMTQPIATAERLHILDVFADRCPHCGRSEELLDEFRRYRDDEHDLIGQGNAWGLFSVDIIDPGEYRGEVETAYATYPPEKVRVLLDAARLREAIPLTGREASWANKVAQRLTALGYTVWLTDASDKTSSYHVLQGDRIVALLAGPKVES